MDLSPATIKNEWAFARAWLHRELAGQDATGEDATGDNATDSSR